MLRALFAFLVLPYLVVALLAAIFQRSLIYHPSRDATLNLQPAHIPGAKTRPISFKTVDDIDLHGWHIWAPDSGAADDHKRNRTLGKPVFLYFCGNSGNRGHRLEEFKMLAGLGADIVCFDYRGFGDNPGSPNEDAIAADAQAVWQHITHLRLADARQIIIFGESLGGGVATRLAAEMSAAGEPPAGLVLRSTFSRLTDAAACHFPWLPVCWLLVDRYPSIDRISHVTCPILVLHGRRDTIVPFELGERLFAAAPEKSSQGISKRLLPLETADHNDVMFTEPDAVRRAIEDLLDSINPRVATCLIPKDDRMFADLVRKMTYFPDVADDLSPARLQLPTDRIHAIQLKTGDGLTLNGWHFLAEGRSPVDGAATGTEPPPERPVALFFSGNGGNRAYRVPEAGVLTRAGTDVLLFDYRGYGDNPGSPSEQALADDARAVWRYATQNCHIASGRIVLYGESLGGAVATRLAAEMCAAGTPPAGLVLRSTFSTLADVAQHHYPLLPIKMLLQERYDSVERIAQVTCPILMLHGKRDTIVPYAQGRRLFMAAPERAADGTPKLFVELPHADHNDVLETDGESLQEAVNEFVARVARNTDSE
jgi:fermentation-respiration switch protein FrsA (DUF1100 family)